MRELTSASNLQTFMLRLERVSPRGRWSGRFELMLAAAVLQAHLDFVAGLHLPAADPGRQARLALEIEALGKEAAGVRSSLLSLWNSSRLSLSSKKAQEALDGGRRAYGRALGRGHNLMALIIPCSTGWYDATVDR